MVAVRRARQFAVEQCGASMIETLVVLNILVLIVVAFIEFGFAINQWNLAAKATQVGARLATVSNPVDSGLPSWTGLGPDANTPPFPGDPVTDDYRIVCHRKDASCAVTGTYSGPTPAYDATAMEWLITGSADPQPCNASGIRLGMCDVLPRLSDDPDVDVVVTYQYTGLGYAGRPGGAVPTVSVALSGLKLDFLLLGSLLGIGNQIGLPAFTTTMVGEDLSTFSP